jgi:hypothetical protein
MEQLYPAIIVCWTIVFPVGWLANLRASDFRGKDAKKMLGNAMVGYGSLFIGAFLGFLLLLFQGDFDLPGETLFFLSFIFANVVAFATTTIIIMFGQSKESY